MFNFTNDRKLAGTLPNFNIRYQYKVAKIEMRTLLDLLFIHPIDARRIRRIIAESDGRPVRVSLGSGQFVQPGWFGIDLKRGPSVFRADLRRKLPLAAF